MSYSGDKSIIIFIIAFLLSFFISHDFRLKKISIFVIMIFFFLLYSYELFSIFER